MGNTTEVLQEKLKMATYFKVQKTKAPESKTLTKSQWRPLFESMKPGEWFIVPKKDYARTQAAGSTYLKGRYSLYKINEKSDYCFLKKA